MITSLVYWTYWKPTHVRHFKVLRLRVTGPRAVQALKWEKAFHSHSSTEDGPPPAKHFTSHVTTLASGFVFTERAFRSDSTPNQRASSATRFWSFTLSASVHRTDVCSRRRFERSVSGSQSFMKLNYDLWLRWGMSPVFLCDKRTPKRPRLGQEESGGPIWIMCLTNVNIWKK